MTLFPTEIRQRVAARARAYKNGEISWDAFMHEFGELLNSEETEDDLVVELISEIQHEPRRGGFWGLNERQWKKYEQNIYQLIEELSR